MPSLTWYFKRARGTSPGELLYRSRMLVRRQLSRIILDHRSEAWVDKAVASLASMCDAPFGGARTPHFASSTLARAEALLAGRVELFGEERLLETTPNWHANPTSGATWPLIYSFDLDYRDDVNGDVKLVWELNRQQFLPTLARAYVLSGDRRFLERLEALWVSWLDSNPFLRGINWSSAYECALRLISWCDSMRLVGPALSPDTARRVLVAADLHVRLIRSNLSLFSSANNHLLGEIAGIAYASEALLLPSRQRLLPWAVATFVREFDKQVTADGVSREQSLYYHWYVLDLALLIFAIGLRVGIPLPDGFLTKVARMGGFLLANLHGQVGRFGFGDEDGGRAFSASDRPVSPIWLTAETVRLLFDALPQLGVPDSEHFMHLFGDEMSPRLADRAQDVRAEGIFPEGGYYVFRGDRTAWSFDFGSLGLSPIAAHGHADCLSLNVQVGADSLLLDPGTYTYNGEYAWRQFFRGTSAHNTVVVDGKDQSQQEAPFIWSNHAASRLVRFVEKPEGVLLEACHDGYQRLKQGVRHFRKIFFQGEIWIVQDRFEGTGNHLLEQNLHSALAARKADSIVYLLGSQKYRVLPLSGQEVSIRVGQYEPLMGWQSRKWGECEPCNSITLSRKGPVPCEMSFAFGSEEAIAGKSFGYLINLMENNSCVA